MTDAAIIQATYSEWKMVKTRKVLVLSFEVPLEAQAAVMAALGTPMPDAETWVAIARLNLNAATAQAEPPAIEHQPEADIRKPKSLAQIAGIICNEPAFWRYIDVPNAEEAAEYVRSRCGISTRSALDSNPDAAMVFRTLRADYQIWMQGGVAA
jgi:hypothetical protein